jgi:NIPSNAP/TAT (twin-arginine translocation) pathway signal sequence
MKPIDRRDFLKTSLAASAAALAGTKASAAEPVAAPGRDYLELRSYRMRAVADHALLDSYLEKALLPALNARGIGAVGVFTELEPRDGKEVWVLIAHPSLESVASVTAGINADPAVQAAGAAYLTTPTKADPAFDRIDSWLHLAFSGLPRLAVPALATAGKARIFELRTYESPTELKALNKVAMFNAGEIKLMQDLDLSPVFYGQALLGRDLPHLTYMLCSPDMETHKRNWGAFGAHPIWNKLKNDPQYADNVSKVISRFLVPAPYSQI